MNLIEIDGITFGYNTSSTTQYDDYTETDHNFGWKGILEFSVIERSDWQYLYLVCTKLGNYILSESFQTTEKLKKRILQICKNYTDL